MTSPSSPARRQPVAGLGLAAFAAAVIGLGGLVRPTNWLDPSQSETLFPTLTLALLMLCGGLIAGGVAAGDDARDEATSRPLRIAGMGLIVAGYAIALPFAGFVIATAALHVAVALALGFRNWLALGLFAIGIIGLCWLVFIALMGVPLKP